MFKYVRKYWILILLVFLVMPLSAHAQCISPPGAAGDMIFNQDERVLQWCDGSTWYAAGQIGPAGPNDGCVGPVGVGGDIIYNQDEDLLQYCDGDHWQGVGGGADMIPDTFTFSDLTNQSVSTTVTSNIATITGIDATTDVVIQGDGTPQFRINGGAWVTSGNITDGDTLQLRMTTSASLSTANTATVYVGTVEATWSASTVGADTTPNAFSFNDRTGIALSTLTTSNTITITGINASTAVSVSGSGSPQISINGGAWVTSGSISNGQSLQVRLTSSGSYATTFSATVNVGGITDQWDVTTQALFTASAYTGNGTNSNGTSSPSINNIPIGTASANRWVVVGLASDGNSTRTVLSVTIGGVPATIAEQETASGGGESYTAAVAYAKVPTGTTATVSWTLSGSMSYHTVWAYTIEYIGADLTLQTSQGTSISHTAGNVMVGVCAYYTTSQNISWSNATESTEDDGGQGSTSSGYRLHSTTGNETSSCSHATASALVDFSP